MVQKEEGAVANLVYAVVVEHYHNANQYPQHLAQSSMPIT